jgi:hypothetical protein
MVWIETILPVRVQLCAFMYTPGEAELNLQRMLEFVTYKLLYSSLINMRYAANKN